MSSRLRAELEEAIDEYINFYNNERIKVSLGGMSIKDYRKSKEKCTGKCPKPLLSYNPKMSIFTRKNIWYVCANTYRPILTSRHSVHGELTTWIVSILSAHIM